MPLLFLLSGPKIGFFRPAVVTHCPLGPLPLAKFHVYRGTAEMWESPKTVKISNFGHTFAPQGSLVCTFFTKFCARLYVAFTFLIRSLLEDNQPSYE